MDNAAEQFDLVTALWRLDGFKGTEAEIGQDHAIDEGVAATDTGRMSRLRKLLASLHRLVAQ
jgi:hypothetical protein